jgi:rhodanese-related sulfurtransferase
MVYMPRNMIKPVENYMKLTKTVLALSLTTLLSFNAFCQQLTTADFEKGITVKNTQLLDVRTAAEYSSGHIANSLQADWNNQDQFRSRAGHLDKTKPLYVYCASGGRSKAAAQWLRTNGYTEVYELTGGFIQWKRDGRPVEGVPATSPMTMDAFNAEIAGSGVVLVDIGAPWCPPCRKMEPVLQSLQRDMAGKYKLVKIDAGIHTDLMKQLKASEIPTFILYHHGREIWRKTGIVEVDELKKVISDLEI